MTNIFVCRLNGFPLDSCQLLASSLLNLIHNCYWRGIQMDGCVSADENELAEACLETLSVSIDTRKEKQNLYQCQ